MFTANIKNDKNVKQTIDFCKGHLFCEHLKVLCLNVVIVILCFLYHKLVGKQAKCKGSVNNGYLHPAKIRNKK